MATAIVWVELNRDADASLKSPRATQVDPASTRKLKIESWETSIEDSIERRTIFSALKKNLNMQDTM